MSMTQEGVTPRLVRYTADKRCEIVARALKLRKDGLTINACAKKLKVGFSTLQRWLYHPQHEKLREQARQDKVNRKPAVKEPSMDRALRAYDAGQSFAQAAVMGRVAESELKKALQARQAKPRPRHFHFR